MGRGLEPEEEEGEKRMVNGPIREKKDEKRGEKKVGISFSFFFSITEISTGDDVERDGKWRVGWKNFRLEGKKEERGGWEKGMGGRML